MGFCALFRPHLDWDADFLEVGGRNCGGDTVAITLRLDPVEWGFALLTEGGGGFPPVFSGGIMVDDILLQDLRRQTER